MSFYCYCVKPKQSGGMNLFYSYHKTQKIIGVLELKMLLFKQVLLGLVLMISFSASLQAQSDVCEQSAAFCTTEPLVFPAGTNNGSAASGPDYGCLGSQPNPAWFHVLISVAGNLQLNITTNPSQDIDFICWGPFVDPVAACNGELTSAAIEDCSYSPNAFETCNITGALVGEYYIIMITNFSNQPTNISFSQDLGGGGGATDCDIVTPQANNNSPICVGETLELYADDIPNATYTWSGPDGFSSHEQNPTIPNAQPENTGIYNVYVTVNGSTSDPATTSAIIVSPPNTTIKSLDGTALDTFRLCYSEEMKFKVQFWNIAGVTWNNGSTGQVSSFYGTSGEVIVNASNTTGCISGDTVYLDIIPEINFTLDLPDFCDGDASVIINDKVDSTGGVFSGAAVSQVGDDYYLDPNTIPVGDSVKTYYNYSTYGCTKDDSVWTKNYILPQVFFNPADNRICIDEGLIDLTEGTPSGGYYYGPGVNSATSQFDPDSTSTGEGHYTIHYSFTDGHGCSSIKDTIMEVLALPHVVFGSIPAVCAGNGVYSLTQGNHHPDGVYSGPGVNSTTGEFDPVSAGGVGFYTLIYTYADADNCEDTAQRIIEVIPMPEVPVGIDVDHNSYCFNDKPATIELSINNIGDSFKWYRNDIIIDSLIGDQTSITVNAPEITTTYLVRSETTCGESVTESIIVTVHPNPNADFITNDVCNDITATFTDNSSIINGNITSWEWDFGDGQFGTGQNVSHLYANPGDHSVQLTVLTDHNCGSIISKDIMIFTMPETPTGIAVNQNNYCFAEKPNDIELSITNSGDEFRWYRNSISPDSLIGNTTTLSILSPDTTTTYIVRSENDCGESTTESITVTVYPSPKADYSFLNSCQMDEVIFKDMSSIPYGSIISWEWDFGEGHLANGASPDPYAYSTYGTIGTQLTVSTIHNCQSVLNRDIIIHPKPVTGFSFTEVCKGEITTFTDNSDGFGSTIIDYSWNFNNSEGTSNLANPTFPFNDWGLKDVELIVNTEHDCKDTLMQQVLVDSLPLPGFLYDNPCKSNVVTFTDTSDVNGKIISDWNWSFGDGESSTESNPQHVYQGAASFHDVTLSLTDTKGCSNTSTISQVYVNPDFSVSIEAGKFCVNREETLLAKSNDPNITMDSWEWIIDGTSYSTADEIHLNYSTAGLRDIQLVGTLVTNGKPCTSGDQFDADVKNLPQTEFSFDVPNLDFPTQFTDETILDDPNASITTWAWDFKDNGATSGQQNPSHLFSIDGTYQVELYVLDDNTCEKKITKDVEVNPKPGANFTFTKVCDGATTVFTDASDSPDGPILSWQWNFGEPASGGNNSSDQKDPIHEYAQAGSYQVKLIIQAFGYDTITKDVIVYKLPQTQFNWSTPCLNEKISLSDRSIAGDGTINQWNWTISDGSTLTEQNPQHIFPSIGDFDITLLTTDEYGCKDSQTQTINIKEPPSSNFTYSLNCLNSPTEFTDQSSQGGSAITSYAWDFGDGTSATLGNPRHTYTAEGSYATKLTVVNADGCQDFNQKSIVISPLPAPDFRINTNLCEDETIYVKTKP